MYVNEWMDQFNRTEKLGLEEGDTCNRNRCTGKMEWERNEEYGGCSCHMGRPPCASCTNQVLTCNECYFEVEE